MSNLGVRADRIPMVSVCIIILLVFLLSACASKQVVTDDKNPQNIGSTPNTSGEELSAPVIASDFSLTDQKGNTRKLSEFKGKVVWLTFWATWCHACKMEMSFLEKIRSSLSPEKCEILAINIDSADRQSMAMAQTRALKLSYPILFDHEQNVVAQYNPRMELPFAVLIDKQGKQRYIQRGFVAGEHIEIERRIRALIEE